MQATLYHNPRCSTSRNTLALLRERGIEPRIVHYLEEPLTREAIAQLIAASGLERVMHFALPRAGPKTV